MPPENPTYSIAYRLKRVTHEDAYISVLLTADLMKTDADGKLQIDWEKFTAEAIRIGQMEGVDWQVEDTELGTHPSQGPRPENRRGFDSANLPENIGRPPEDYMRLG